MKKLTSLILILVGLVYVAVGPLTIKSLACALIIAIVCAVVKFIDILLQEEHYDSLPNSISTCLGQMTLVYWFAGLGYYNSFRELFTLIATPKNELWCGGIITVFTLYFIGTLIDGIYEKSYD